MASPLTPADLERVDSEARAAYVKAQGGAVTWNAERGAGLAAVPAAARAEALADIASAIVVVGTVPSYAVEPVRRALLGAVRDGAPALRWTADDSASVAKAEVRQTLLDVPRNVLAMASFNAGKAGQRTTHGDQAEAVRAALLAAIDEPAAKEPSR